MKPWFYWICLFPRQDFTDWYANRLMKSNFSIFPPPSKLWNSTHSYGAFGLELGSHLPEKKCFIFLNKSSSKRVKNAFRFALKAISVLKIFNVFDFLGHVGKWLDNYG